MTANYSTVPDAKIFLRCCAIASLAYIAFSFILENQFKFSSFYGSTLGVSFALINLSLFAILLRGLLEGGSRPIVLLIALMAKGFFILLFLALILSQEENVAYSALFGALIFIPAGLLMAARHNL